MEYQKIYDDLREQIRVNKRPYLKLNGEKSQLVLAEVKSALKNDQIDLEIEKILCILNHVQGQWPHLEETTQLLLDFLLSRESTSSTSTSKDHWIFSLAAIQKQVIAPRHMRGERVPPSFLKILRQLLLHPEAEVQEWTLRTIESLGGQGILFKQELQQLPRWPWALFNPHKRNSKKIIESLLKKWTPPQK